MGGKIEDFTLQILAWSRHKERVAEPEEQWSTGCVHLITEDYNEARTGSKI